MVTKSRTWWFVCATLLFSGLAFVTPQTASADTKGQDLPGTKCQRNNKDGSTTTGQCSSVCKDLVVSDAKDPDSGLRTCEEKATVVSGWGIVAITGHSSVQFLRYNEGGEVQACKLGAKADEVECHRVRVRVLEAK
jgi:hypothetical protein